MPRAIRVCRWPARVCAVVFCTTFVFVVRPSAAQEPDPSSGTRTPDVRASARALAEAMHARDRAAMERLLAPDYVLRGAPDADRDTWIHNALTLCWGDRSDIDAFRASRHGDAVVASFELTFYVDPATCRPAVVRSLVTDVWTRHPDGWRLHVRHAGAPPAADAGVSGQYGLVPQPPPVWDATAELSLVATGGNTSTRTLGAGATLVHRASAGTTRAALAFVTSETDDVTRAESLALQARHGYHVERRVEVFGRASYARDRFAGIDDRVAAEIGVGHTAARRAHALTAEGSVGFTVEERLDATELRFVTLTGTLHYVWTIRAGTEVMEDLSVASDVETAGNWRGVSTTALAVSLTRLLSLKASHSFEYRNRPVAGFGRLDMRTAAAFVLSWQQRPALP